MSNLHNSKIDLGGKANSLKILKENGLNVPNFFVISREEFQKFIVENNLENVVLDLLQKHKYNEVKNLILQTKVSKNFENEIFSQFNKLNSKTVAVRSSAQNEDGKEKSFAGQFETFLYVTKEDLIKSIKKCWCSNFDNNVVEYSKGDIELYAMNVIVQEMISAEYSGVAFSLDPTSRSKNYSVIEVVKGDGEKLVSGLETPTTILVQRYLKEVDFYNGDFLPDQKIIIQIEENLLEIEKLYGLPVDVEWCVKNNSLYILQARPITAFNIIKERFDLTLTREDCLYELETYRNGEFFGILNLTKHYYFEPLFYYNAKSEMVEIYYNWHALEENPPSFFRELEKNFESFKYRYNEAIKCCDKQKKIINGKITFNLQKFIENEIIIQPFSSIGNTVGAGWDCSERVKKLLVDFRDNHDNIIYLSNEFLKNKINEILPAKFSKYLKVLTLEEILNQDKINFNELEKRLKGYVYFAGKIYTCSLEEFLKENSYYIEKEEFGIKLQGRTAYGGRVEGNVNVVIKTSDFCKFQEGDILVTHMTTPKFTPIIKKSKGIITDEGGITCHAAIVARELKIPCVVGVKSATKRLKDGVKVVLNGDTGEVEIIK